MKVLIISHNPITSYHNMGKTLKNLFCLFDKEELCQLYCYPTIPDVDFCESYFRITDIDVLRSFYSGFRVLGREILSREISPENGVFENSADQVNYNVTQDYKRILRDIMWRCSCWYNRDLKRWLAEQRPDCIFVAPGDARFLYEIALRISKKLRIPIVAYFCDDYYFQEGKKSAISEIRFRLLKREIRKFFRNVSHCVYICREMQEKYGCQFGVPGSLIMTGTDNIEDKNRCSENAGVLTYMGNVRCNRFYSLNRVGRMLDQINIQCGTDLQLHIYTDEKDTRINKLLLEPQSVRLHGFLRGEAYKKVFYSSDLLLHTEAFDSASKEQVKHSVSTKIAESLASGIPVFAYGPDSVASMAHLIRNDCAITATSDDMLCDALQQAFFDSDRRLQVTENALKTAWKFHNAEENGREMRKIMEACCRKA